MIDTSLIEIRTFSSPEEIREFPNFIEEKLPFNLLWSDWDKCIRVRQAVIDHFVNGYGSIDAFARAVMSEDLFDEVVSQAKNSFRGTDFLRRLHDVLCNLSDTRSIRRVKHIAALIFDA
jgi:hypothetical protein